MTVTGLLADIADIAGHRFPDHIFGKCQKFIKKITTIFIFMIERIKEMAVI
jgi:hypothetical protein